MSTVQTASKDKVRETPEPEKAKKPEAKADPPPAATAAVPKLEGFPPSTAQALHPVHPTAIENLSSLSEEGLSARLAEAQALVAEVEREIELRRAKKASDFLASIREQARALGLDPQAIAAALGKKAGTRTRSSGDARATVAPKYRNPETSQTWAGRGVRPKWIELDPATGKPLAKFLIPASS
jgi:DNA-binding protein H-NS